MSNLPLSFNPFQTAISILQPKFNYLVSGRGWGKSTYFGHMLHQIVNNMPGASGVIAAKTFTHVLTSILPSAFAHLERLGYMRDIHYVIGKRPPKSWKKLPYQPPVKDYSNYITFYNSERCVGFFLTSQEREGSGRGPNTDFLLTDETLRLDKKKLDNELVPTVRANKDKFGHIPWHLGQYHSTSMPYSNESKWILETGNYYLEEYGIDYFSLWRTVVKAQLELLRIEDPEEFRMQWNEVQRLRKKMKPLLSKDGMTLFTLSNAFDNIDNVGLSYIKQQSKTLPQIVFLIEIMNDIISMVENGYYAMNEDIHVYYDSWDDDFSNDLAINSNFNFATLSSKTAAFLSHRYYNPLLPVHLFFDWGGTISFCLAAQFNKNDNTLHIIKEFYQLPGDEMPKNLMKQVNEFFFTHTNKKINFVKDTLGDDKSRSLQSSQTINEDSIKTLRSAGWEVSIMKHQYKEPPQDEKWLLMQKLFTEKDSSLFKIRIDGNNCKYLLISMRDTKVKQSGNKLEKDKSSERKLNVDQRTATHSTDALDKGCYWLSKNIKEHTFIDVNIR